MVSKSPSSAKIVLNHNEYDGLPQWLSSKESACHAGDPGSITGLGRLPGEGHDNSLQFSCLGSLIDRGSWPSTSPWGCKELDMTEWLTHAHPHTHTYNSPFHDWIINFKTHPNYWVFVLHSIFKIINRVCKHRFFFIFFLDTSQKLYIWVSFLVPNTNVCIS